MRHGGLNTSAEDLAAVEVLAELTSVATDGVRISHVRDIYAIAHVVILLNHASRHTNLILGCYQLVGEVLARRRSVVARGPHPQVVLIRLELLHVAIRYSLLDSINSSQGVIECAIPSSSNDSIHVSWAAVLLVVGVL